MPESPHKIPALLNISALSRYLGVGRTTTYEWLYSEQLPPAAKIINKRRYWTRKQIEIFLDKENRL
jgi:predicted DNA-binding transcriptional regulator AlpA